MEERVVLDCREKEVEVARARISAAPDALRTERVAADEDDPVVYRYVKKHVLSEPQSQGASFTATHSVKNEYGI